MPIIAQELLYKVLGFPCFPSLTTKENTELINKTNKTNKSATCALSIRFKICQENKGEFNVLV